MFDWWSDVKLTGLCGWSWVVGTSVAGLGASVGGLGAFLELFSLLFPSFVLFLLLFLFSLLFFFLWAIFGRSQGLWDDLGPLLGHLCAILAALGPSVGVPGPSWLEKWPLPGRECDLGNGLGQKVSQTPAGTRSPGGRTVDGKAGNDGMDRISRRVPSPNVLHKYIY